MKEEVTDTNTSAQKKPQIIVEKLEEVKIQSSDPLTGLEKSLIQGSNQANKENSDDSDVSESQSEDNYLEKNHSACEVDSDDMVGDFNASDEEDGRARRGVFR